MTLFRRYALKEWYPGKSEEVFYNNFLKSPRLAPTINLKANRQKRLEFWCGSKQQQLPTNSTIPISKHGAARRFRSRAALDRQNEEVKSENEEVDQANTGQPVVQRSGMLEFRIQGLLQPNVEEAEQGRVRDLIYQIESHLYQDDLQADLRQNNIFNPFTKIRRRWSTNLETWNILNYAEQTPGYDAPIVSIILGKRYWKLYLWNLPQSYGRHASTESKKICCIVDFESCDKESMFSRSQTWEIRRTNLLSQVIQRMEEMPENEDNTFLSFLTDLSKIQDTVRRRRSMEGQKPTVKRWTN